MKSIVILNKIFFIVKGKCFYYVWLWDNCLFLKFCYLIFFQKLYEMKYILCFELLFVEEKDGELIIIWNEDFFYKSIFLIFWLLSYVYDDGEQDNENEDFEFNFQNQEFLWDKVWIEVNILKLQEVFLFNFELWFEQFFIFGFIVFYNILVKDLQVIIEFIGLIYNGDYGLFVLLKIINEGKDLVEIGNVMSFYIDYIYWYILFLFISLYCVENSVFGGELLIVDGFRVVDDFCQ